MTAVKTQIGAKDLAVSLPFQPTLDVPATDVQRAIEMAAAGGGGAWGSITGTLSDQTDLQAALDGKLDDAQASPFGLSLLDDSSAADARATLGLGTLATQSGTFSGTSSGSNTGDQTIVLTGDVAGSGTGSFAATIVANAVSNSKLAQMPAGTIKGNNAGSTANAGDLTGTQVQALLTAQPTVQTFTPSGTWTKPTGCKTVRVRVVGGGGGGGGATAAASQCCAASGGGSGGFGEGIYDVTGTSTVTVTIGAGGAGGAAANGTGGSGGTTSFGALLSAAGGTGGSGMTSGTAASYVTAAAPAAAGSGGAVNAGGNSGLPGHRASASIFMSGLGAPSYLGGGGRGVNFAAAGTAGGAPGAGGAGAASSSATGFAGGAGAAGIVIVEEFY